MTDLFTPLDPVVVADPFPSYKRLRDEAPAYWLESEGVWVISRYSDVFAVMQNWQDFSSAKGNIIHEDPQRVGRTLTTNDPPRHDHLRSLIQLGYTPRRVRAHEERIRKYVDELINDVAGRPFEFLTEFASPLTGRTIGSLIGVPEHDLDYLREIVDEATATDDGNRTMAEVFAYMKNLVADRRMNPVDDMISVFCRAGEKGIEVTDEDIAVTCGSILGAGFSSAAHQLTLTMHALFRNPDQRRMVTADPTLIPAMIEESIRWDVATAAFARQTTREVEVAGTTIPADSRLMVLLSSANRDDRRFPDADVFDVHRQDKQHLGFNVGIHHCLGSALARMMMKAAFESLLPNLGDFELDLEQAVRVRSLNFRGFRTLPVHPA